MMHCDTHPGLQCNQVTRLRVTNLSFLLLSRVASVSKSVWGGASPRHGVHCSHSSSCLVQPASTQLGWYRLPRIDNMLIFLTKFQSWGTLLFFEVRMKGRACLIFSPLSSWRKKSWTGRNCRDRKLRLKWSAFSSRNRLIWTSTLHAFCLLPQVLLIIFDYLCLSLFSFSL